MNIFSSKINTSKHTFILFFYCANQSFLLHPYIFMLKLYNLKLVHNFTFLIYLIANFILNLRRKFYKIKSMAQKNVSSRVTVPISVLLSKRALFYE